MELTNTDRVEKAKEILANIRYVTIASASKESEPWGTPVLAAFDEQYNFYWTSMNNTQHSKNILENSRVYLTCFDSTVVPGEGGGVSVKAVAMEMTDQIEITKAIELVYSRKNKPKREVKEFLGESQKRMYKATPEKFWVNLDIDLKTDSLNVKKEIRLP